MTKFTTALLATATLAGLWMGAVLPSAAQQVDFKTVPPKLLLENPQSFWARGVVFEDELTRLPSGRTQKFDDLRYVEMETKVLGECYAKEELVPVIQKLKVNETYLFSGTIFQRKKNKYVYIIDAVSARLDALGELASDIQKIAESPELLPQDHELRIMSELASLIEQRLFAYMEERGIGPEEVFSDSDSAGRVIQDIARTSIRQLEQDANVRSSDLLARYMGLVISRKYSAEIGTPLPGSDAMKIDEDAPSSFEDALAPVTMQEDEPPAPEEEAPTDMDDAMADDGDEEADQPAPTGSTSEVEDLFKAVPLAPAVEEPPPLDIDLEPMPEEMPVVEMEMDEPAMPEAAAIVEEPAVDEVDRADVDAAIEDIEAMVEEEATPIESMPDKVTDALDDLDAELADLADDMPATEEVVDEPVIDDLDALEAELADLADDMPATEEAVDEPVIDDLDALEAELADLADDMPATEEAVDEPVIDDLDALDAELADLADDMPATEEAVDEPVIDDLDALDAELADLADDMPASEDELAGLDAELAALTEDLPNTEALDDLDAELAELAEPETTVAATEAMAAGEVDALDLLDAELAEFSEVVPATDTAMDDLDAAVEILATETPSGPRRFSVGPFRFPILEP